MGLLQRIFDEHDLSTVSITLAPDITRLAKPSLACFVAHPFGLPCGGVGDKVTQRAVVGACLREAALDQEAGTIVDLGFRWPDDLRERQLRSPRIVARA